ncbi:MAG: DUF3383 domain-containing protein [Synergistaceae bacterium]|nr:DUF3383 domain-containing protein [Synergistaceae bacterium]
MAKDYTALDIGRVINVTVNLQPVAAARRSFGTLLILGDSDVIDQGERLRAYTSLDGVAGDFGLGAPEYYAAALYYGQTPKPLNLMVGRWVSDTTHGLLKGGVLSPSEKTLSLWTAVTDGGFTVNVGGSAKSVTGLDFSMQTNLDGVASVISAALGTASAGVSVVWDGDRFTVATDASGTTASVGYASAPSAGTDISAMMKLTEGLAPEPVQGADAETPAEAVARAAEMSGEWYGLMFAAETEITDDENIEVSGFIEGTSQSRIFGITSSSSLMLEATVDTDIASALKKLGYKRSFVQFSTRNPYAVASMFGRAFSVNFNANRSAITLKFKQEPGVVYEQITESRAQALAAKNANVFAYYNTDQAILQEGTMANGAFFDEVHGTDWLQNALQIELWNALYQSKTKIPQTNAGMNILATVCKKVCEEGQNNGLIADSGTWNADGFGELERGDVIPGFYIYFQDVNLQPQSEREQRKATAIQIAIKLAGAIHFVDVIVDVNR